MGRTRRVYTGGAVARTLWKVMTLTGTDAGGSHQAEVLDGDGRLVATIAAHNDSTECRTELRDPTGEPLGIVHRPIDGGMELKTPDGTALAQMTYRPGQPDPIEVHGAEGGRVAVLTRGDLPGASPTAHLGFAGATAYTVELQGPAPDEPLRSLLALLPVIAAYSY